jgi:hypothetical protein
VVGEGQKIDESSIAWQPTTGVARHRIGKHMLTGRYRRKAVPHLRIGRRGGRWKEPSILFFYI